MTRKTNGLAIALLAALLLVSTYAMFPVSAPARADVDIRFYGSHEAAYTALKAGDVDFIQWSVTYEQRLDVEADPNLAIAGYSENGMMEFDLNNNYTVPMNTYAPDVRNPLNDKHFRRALSCMVDKEHIINFILKGAAGLLNVPIPLNSISWWPDSALPGVYPWAYDMLEAENQLALAGFVDTDADGIRNYPAGWPGREAGPNMDPLDLCVRTEDKRLDAGRYLADQLTIMGIPYEKLEATSDVLFPKVMDDRNYHIYTGGWSLGRYPTFLYFGFHSDFYYAGGPNYVTGMNEFNTPNYPDYDALAYDVYYTDSIALSKAAAKAAADLGWVDYVFNIPLWSYSSFVAWRKTMPGVVNQFGYGYDNAYQFLNAYNTLPGPIRMGTINAPKALNPLYSTWYYDYAVLDRMFNGLMMVNPYDLAIDQPGAAQDWEVGTWIDPDPGPGEPSEKTMLRYYLKENVGIVSPTGTFVRNLKAQDLESSTWYTYAFDDAWNWPSYSDVHHTKIIDDFTIEFYFDSSSYWFYTSPQYPILRHETILSLCREASTSIVISGGNVTVDRTVYLDIDAIVHVKAHNIPVEFDIVAGYENYRHVGIQFHAMPPDGTYTITYYTPDLDPHGYYLAGLDWTQTWYTFGPFYPVAIVPGVGGYAVLNKNPYFWMPTHPVSEIDWQWWWDTPIDPNTGMPIPGPEIPGRDSGYYEITIYDAVRLTASYDAFGSGPYDPAYFPGADLDPTDLGHVGINDLVSVTSYYGDKWGAPP